MARCIGCDSCMLACARERIVQTSTDICLFARGVYDLETISRALGSVGIERTVDELWAMSQRIWWDYHSRRTAALG
jgi:Fe-S-cluster-containing hydrogenase component 2